MLDPSTTDITVKVATNIITAVLKSTVKGLQKADAKMRSNTKGLDLFDRGAAAYARKLLNRYGSMRILGMQEPIPINDLYVRVSILDKVTSMTRATVEELEAFFDKDKRHFARPIKSCDGMKVVESKQKIMVLGKPGAGKTTFLKVIAIQCLSGRFGQNYIPIYIGLKEWADSEKPLIDYIKNEFVKADIPEAPFFVDRLLNKGRCLILLDGLDEVAGSHIGPVYEINEFVDTYDNNKFVISCRIAAHDYVFRHFSEVEIADFSPEQIRDFIMKWYNKDEERGERCWNKLIDNKPIFELSSNPLLLTLICIAFDETLEFPQNRAELYKEAVDALLKKWDASRGIERDAVYKGLSLRNKVSLLSEVAVKTFQEGNYFISQSKIEFMIMDFMDNMFGRSEVDIDGEAILKSIEAQHGIFVERAKSIYSFSHLTIQEYFAARYIVDYAIEGSLHKLVKYNAVYKEWREVILLVAGMLPKSDFYLLSMRREASKSTNEHLFALLAILNEVSSPILPPFLQDANNTYLHACMVSAYIAYLLKSPLNHPLTERDSENYNFESEGSVRTVSSAEFNRSDALFEARSLFKVLTNYHKLPSDVDDWIHTQWIRDNALSISRPMSSLLEEAPVGQLVKYLRYQTRIIECIDNGCYLSKDVRSLLEVSILREPWERTSPL